MHTTVPLHARRPRPGHLVSARRPQPTPAAAPAPQARIHQPAPQGPVATTVRCQIHKTSKSLGLTAWRLRLMRDRTARLLQLMSLLLYLPAFFFWVSLSFELVFFFLSFS